MSIDMNRSGWDNPDGFKPREREQAPPPAPACEVEGPDGWVCDLPPGHGGPDHKADGGPSWVIDSIDGKPAPAPLSEKWEVMPPSEADHAILAKVREVAQKGREDHYPAAWAVALADIMELTDGY
jgi:hypothetical protein